MKNYKIILALLTTIFAQTLSCNVYSAVKLLENMPREKMGVSEINRLSDYLKKLCPIEDCDIYERINRVNGWNNQDFKKTYIPKEFQKVLESPFVPSDEKQFVKMIYEKIMLPISKISDESNEINELKILEALSRASEYTGRVNETVARIVSMIDMNEYAEINMTKNELMMKHLETPDVQGKNPDNYDAIKYICFKRHGKRFIGSKNKIEECETKLNATVALNSLSTDFEQLILGIENSKDKGHDPMKLKIRIINRYELIESTSSEGSQSSDSETGSM